MNPVIRHTSIATFLVVLLLAGSCDESPTETLFRAEPLLPLAIGNEWTFHTTYYDSLGNVTAQMPGDTVRIIADTLIDGKRWYYRHYLGHLVGFRNSEMGTLIRLVSANTDGISRVLFENPTAIGHKYDYPEVTFSGSKAWLSQGGHVATVGAYDTSATVPAGSFRCLLYSVAASPSWSEYRRDFFVAPGDGWIRTDFHARVRPGGQIYKLRSDQLTSLTKL